jgi:short-subunit dehydrogenase
MAMRRDLPGQRILITGASSGIGRALAEQAAARGARVLLAARSADALDELAQGIQARGGEAVAVAADLTAAADRRRLLAVAAERFDGLDVLINNAGVASWGHFAGGTEAILRQVMEVNFFAPAELIRAAVPLLARGQRPAVVNVCSMCGRRGIPAWSEYSASKFGLAGLSEALRAELTRFGVDVLLIVPGLTRSGMNGRLLRNEGRAEIAYNKGMVPEAVARAILGSLRRRRRETVLGWEARWILWVNKWLPRLVDYLLARKVRQLYAAEKAAPINDGSRAPGSEDSTRGFTPATPSGG